MEAEKSLKNILTAKRIIIILFSLIPSLVVLLFRPFSLTLSQAAAVASLLVTIIWWATKLVDRTVASIILLLAFCLFGETPLTGVFTFPLSETFILILVSFLFSEGVKNSGLMDKLLLPLLCRWAISLNRALCSMLIINLAMIFIIPQAFSRIILVALIYERFFLHIGMEERSRQILMLCLHMSSIFVNMMFLRGDFILNGALLNISGADISEASWMACMAVPALIFSIFGTFAFRLVFWKQLKAFPSVRPMEPQSWSFKERRNLIILLAIILLWALEDIHGISGTLIVCVGTLIMIPLGLLGHTDLRCVDVSLLVFLTAAFSIGSVMKTSGAATVIFTQFTPLFPNNFSLGYLLIILVVCVSMHMLLGSSITTMSVVIPSLMVITEGVVATTVLLFSVYIAASAHCILPFHNVITMIGGGRGHFQGQDMARYGAAMTIPIILSVLFVFYRWWAAIGYVSF